MYRLQNEYLKAVFDGQARLTWLENLREGSGNIIDKPGQDAFLLNCKNGEKWEDIAFGHNQQFKAEQKGNTLKYHCESLRTRNGENRVSLTLSITLEGENLYFDADIKNTQSDLLVIDFEYPKLGIIKNIGGKEPSLFAPFQAGVRVDRIGSWLSEKRNSPWDDTRQCNFYSFEINYPGFHGSMHWMALQAAGQTLYTACHDGDFYTSQMRVDGDPEDKGAITLVFEIEPFVKPDECWAAPQSRLKLYKGTWHHGADEYRQWAHSWRPSHEKPQWIQDLLGMFLVINKQQYGDEMWPYDTLPKLYELAQEHGFENLSLFGWFDSGHDNQYPDVEASHSMGGADALKENIQKVQQAGGRVTLYQQGYLFDTTTAFYRNGGYRYECRTRWDTPYYDYYSKAHRSVFLKNYTSKNFAIACPSCPEWRELMVDKTGFVASFGADAVLFDQIGGMWAFPCFNDKHPHDKGKPSLAMSGGRKKLLDAIQKRTKEINSDYAFFSEHINDIYSAYQDCCHGLFLLQSPEGEYLAGAEGKGIVNEPSLFRYCFPETKITIRNPRPSVDKRSANFAFVFGLAFELEIRYEQDREDVLADKWPEERRYSKAVNALRRKYIDELIRADFVDDDPLETYNPQIITKAYENSKTIAVALWNDSEEPKPLALAVKKGHFLEYATIDGAFQKMPETIPPRSIGLVVFQKD
ncbi:hypothetical protein FACS1894109_07670 [Spirochaetia bacterium]|nr:hypothetical protein FACS1894109_07670 [Spirochaetia bacterium]